MELSVYEKADFLRSRGYKVGVYEGTNDYPHYVTHEKDPQLNSSVNYAYNLEIKRKNN